MRNKIHENTAVKLGIEINELSNVKFREVSNSMRRLLSTEAFFMINSDTRTQAVNIQQSLNIGLLNEILQSASNNNIIATNVESTVKNIPGFTIENVKPTVPQTKANSETAITLDLNILIIIGCVAVALILVCYEICSRIKDRKNQTSDFDEFED